MCGHNTDDWVQPYRNFKLRIQPELLNWLHKLCYTLAGSATPLVSTTIDLMPLTFTRYSTAANRSFLNVPRNTLLNNKCNHWVAPWNFGKGCLLHSWLEVPRNPFLSKSWDTFCKLVLDDCKPVRVGSLQQLFDEGGFASPQEPNQKVNACFVLIFFHRYKSHITNFQIPSRLRLNRHRL